MPFFFAEEQNSALDAVQEEVQAREVLLAFHDDIHVVTPQGTICGCRIRCPRVGGRWGGQRPADPQKTGDSTGNVWPAFTCELESPFLHCRGVSHRDHGFHASCNGKLCVQASAQQVANYTSLSQVGFGKGSNTVIPRTACVPRTHCWF